MLLDGLTEPPRRPYPEAGDLKLRLSAGSPGDAWQIGFRVRLSFPLAQGGTP